MGMDISQTFDAVVLAGGDGTPVGTGQPIKGLVEVCGKPMVQWVVEALQKATSIHRIVVVIPAQASRGSWATDVTVIDSVGDILDNCEAGLDAVDGKRPVMWLSADIPALTPEAVDDYASQVLVRGVEASYALILATDIDEQFPGSVRTYIKLKEGRLTGGNIVSCTVELEHRLKVQARQLLNARKEPMKMARVVGPAIAAKFALGALTVPDVEERLLKVFDVHGAGIFTSHACIGADVDKPVDKEVIERALQADQAV